MRGCNCISEVNKEREDVVGLCESCAVIQVRIWADLSEKKTGDIPCIKCDRLFYSKGIEHRICDRCIRANSHSRNYEWEKVIGTK